MFTRRQTLAAGLAALAAGAVRPALADEPELTEDGLYRQSWFLDSFLELADDVDDAAGRGKRLAIMWELKGCPYCRETHFVNMARPDINAFIRARFDVLQLNVIGSRMVTDFDGTEMPEKDLADRYAIRFTPTFQFFPESSEGLAGKDPAAREVARLPGYLKPDHFLKMFEYVDQKAYESMKFRQFMKATG